MKYKDLKVKGTKIKKKIIFLDHPLSIYRLIRLCELINNIYGFDMFGLNLNEI